MNNIVALLKALSKIIVIILVARGKIDKEGGEIVISCIEPMVDSAVKGVGLIRTAVDKARRQ